MTQTHTARLLWFARIIVGALLILLIGRYLLQSTAAQAILMYEEDILYLIGEHLYLVFISGGLAIAIGIPLGIWLSRPHMRSVAETVMQVLNVGTTVPTLAVLALSMTFLGIGTVPAIFTLWLASLIYIVRNTYSGLLSLPDYLLESAQGMGMTPLQTLWQVELPNALFVIFAGVRTALTINIGTVPLAFLIGGGGLGELIFSGIDLNEPYMMLAGAIPTAVLALIVDALLAALAFLVIPKGVNPLR